MNEKIEVVEQTEKNRGGAAPERRQCRRIRENGERCRDWEVRGQGFCFRHGRWEKTRCKGPITVPLLEDAGSIQLVISQTVRAMSLGTIPPANGRVILMGCREARNVLRDKLAERRLAAQMQRWEVAVEDEAPEAMEVVDHGGDWLAPVWDQREILRKREEEWAAEMAARDKARAAAAPAGIAAESEVSAGSEGGEAATKAEGGAEAVGSALEDEPLMPVNWDDPDFFCAEGEKPVEVAQWTAETKRERPLKEREDTPVEPDPLWVPDSPAKFRDLKKNWDNAVSRTERECMDMYFPRAGETREEYNEALARPYEAYFERKAEG